MKLGSRLFVIAEEVPSDVKYRRLEVDVKDGGQEHEMKQHRAQHEFEGQGRGRSRRRTHLLSCCWLFRSDLNHTNNVVISCEEGSVTSLSMSLIIFAQTL